jgi:rubrerythrin
MTTLEYAIKLEHDGEVFYTEQARLNQGNALAKVFMLLAEAERRHAAMLQGRLHDRDDDARYDDAEGPSLFRQMEDYQTDPTSIPRQLDVYHLALEMEQKSIALYRGMLDEAGDDRTAALLKALIEQELQHAQIFETLITLVGRPEDWVEAAEFGPRENY